MDARARGGGRRLKLGVFTTVFGNLPLEQMLDRVVALGLEAVELGTGGYPGSAHCDPDELLGRERSSTCTRKDTALDLANVRRNGVLDTRHYSRIAERSWTFRTVGYGHDERFWGALRLGAGRTDAEPSSGNARAGRSRPRSRNVQ